MTRETLYQLLPSVYRQRDYELGEPLRGLMEVLDAQFEALEADIAGLYDDWFIETCADWVVPYIADLLGLKGIEPSPDGEFSQRAFVANTIAYRRRKGTAPVIEQIGTDLTQYPAKVSEFFQNLAYAMHLNHVRLDRPGQAVVRGAWAASLAHSPFDRLPHQADVRRVAPNRGRYNIPNLGLDLWRVPSLWIEQSDPFPVTASRFLFDPVGRELPLMNRSRVDLGLEASPLPSEVPDFLAWRPLFEELRARRAGESNDTDGVYFGRQPVFEIAVGGVPVAPEDIYVADLEPWRTPSSGVAVDVRRGRVAFAKKPKGPVTVSYASGFPGPVGAGPWDRRLWEPKLDEPDTVGTFGSGEGAAAQAWLDAWDTALHPIARLILRGNASLETGLALKNKPGGSLQIVAENGCRPVIRGGVSLAADALIAELVIVGVWVGGAVEANATLERLVLANVTAKDIAVDAANRTLEATILRSVTGAIVAPRDATSLDLRDCLIDGRPGSDAISAAPGYACPTVLERCTVIGNVRLKSGSFSECIFLDRVECERVQTGCSRFSFIPFGSRVPSRFRCQPSLRYEELMALPGASEAQATEQALRETDPRFVSLDPDSPSYALLMPDCPCAVARGAEDDGEMGVWHLLHHARRMRHLAAALEEYVRFGMEAGVFTQSPRGSQ